VVGGGGQITGQTKKVDDEKSPYVVITIDPGVRVAIPQSQVRRVVTDADLAEYRRHVEKAGDDAELNFELAKWCSANHLSAQSRYHLQRTIDLNPDHAGARATLKYVQDNGQWILHSELQRIRGMVNAGGKWQLPEVVAMKRQQDEEEATIKKWQKDIVRLRSQYLSDGKGSAEAYESLQAIKDPLAAKAVADELNDSRRPKSVQPQSLRQLWIRLLGDFKNQTSVAALVQAGVVENDSVVREAALEQLQKFGRETAVAVYLKMLTSNNNLEVSRAGRALSFFPDPELAFPLVDALVTEHETVTTVGGGTSVGFSSDGGGGMSQGSKQVKIVDRKNNNSVLATLKLIEPQVDFGFNESRWREYFASKLMAYDRDLRRDP
jgi:hypothetical protein